MYRAYCGLVECVALHSRIFFFFFFFLSSSSFIILRAFLHFSHIKCTKYIFISIIISIFFYFSGSVRCAVATFNIVVILFSLACLCIVLYYLNYITFSNVQYIRYLVALCLFSLLSSFLFYYIYLIA